MSKRLSFVSIAILILAGVLLLYSSCSKQVDEAPITLTVGMMSAVDAAPFYHALNERYFQQEGVEVELVLFTNAQNRQTALQTGQIDGSMTDLVALITNTAGKFGLKGTLSTDGSFPLLSKADLGGTGALTVGTMEISVTNYLVDQYLQGREAGKVFINEIPARLEAVAAGQLDAGIFPEPFASIGALRGLAKTNFPGIPPESLNLIAFTSAALDTKHDAIQKFHLAYARAIKDLQADPDKARAALFTAIPNLPESLRTSLDVPQYRAPRLPSDSFIQEIIEWTASVTSSTYQFDSTAIIDRSFIEGP